MKAAVAAIWFRTAEGVRLEDFVGLGQVRELGPS